MNIFQTVGTIIGGFQERDAAKLQAKNARIEKEMAKLREIQIAGAARRQLSGVMGQIQNIRANRNVAGDSQTGQQIEYATREQAYRGEAIARLAEINRAAASSMAEKGYQMQARWAVPMATLNVASGMADDLTRFLTGAGAPAPTGG